MTGPRRVLIVGLGLAGMSTAIRLHRSGWEVDIDERARERGPGGHFIALFGAGRAAASRLGVLDDIDNRASGGAVWEVGRGRGRRPGLGFNSIPSAPWILLRGDVENALFNAMPARVSVRYGASPIQITQDADGANVLVANRDGSETSERYELVVGADGIRSTTRRLTFGPDANFLNPLGYMNATALLDENLTGFAPEDGMVFAEPGRSIWTFAFKNRAPSMLFSYRTDDPERERARRPIDSLRRAFGSKPTGPYVGEALERFEAAGHSIFDSAQQVRMRQFHHGRVVLVGDAAWCMTLYSGFGASCGLAGGDLLGHFLDENPDVPTALAAWNDWMRPHVARQHEAVGRARTLFTPHDRTQHALRTGLIRALNMPGVGSIAQMAMRRNTTISIKDRDLAVA